MYQMSKRKYTALFKRLNWTYVSCNKHTKIIDNSGNIIVLSNAMLNKINKSPRIYKKYANENYAWCNPRRYINRKVA